MKSHQTEGVILRVIDYREADRIVLFYTQDLGKLSALAPHATKSRKRFGTSLNIFQLVRLKFKQKPQRSLALLEQVRPLVSLSGIYGDWRSIAAACAIIDFVNDMTREGSPNPTIYEICRNALLDLNRGQNYPSVLAQFEYHILTASGYQPAISKCVSCHREWQPDETIYWVHKGGGVHCHQCLPRDVPFEIVAPELRIRLEQITQGRVSDEAQMSRAADLLYKFIRYQLGRPVRAWEFLESMKLIS